MSRQRRLAAPLPPGRGRLRRSSRHRLPERQAAHAAVQVLPVCRLAGDVIAGHVRTEQGQGVQHIVFAPPSRIFAYLQQRGMPPGEVAADETLWTHVVQRVRQAVEPAIRHVARQRPFQRILQRQRGAVRVDRLQQSELASPSLFVDAEQRKGSSTAAHRPARRIRGAARAAAHDDAVGLRPDRAHQGGPAHAHALLQLAGGHAAPGAQDGQGFHGHGYGETIVKTE